MVRATREGPRSERWLGQLEYNPSASRILRRCRALCAGRHLPVLERRGYPLGMVLIPRGVHGKRGSEFRSGKSDLGYACWLRGLARLSVAGVGWLERLRTQRQLFSILFFR